MSGGVKRKSRFDKEAEDEPQQKRPALGVGAVSAAGTVGTVGVDVSSAAARAAEMSRDLANKIAMVSSLLHAPKSLPVVPGVVEKVEEKRPAYRPLVLDAQGREVDEYGNIVKADVSHLRTLQANVAVEKAAQKKENPYLAHRAPVNPLDGTASVIPGLGIGAGAAGMGVGGVGAVGGVGGVGGVGVMGMGAEPVLDDRLKLASRDVRARKSLHFVEAGRFIGEEQRLRAFEERKAKAGYASGRKNIEQAQAEKASTDEGADAEKGGADIEAEEKEPSAPLAETLPPSSDLSVPLLEWWDEAFLPRERREAARKVARAVSSSVTAGQQYNEDDPSLLALQHARTYRLLQHPVPVKPLSGERGPAPALPMFLTKHEQKKLRRSTRHEREQEKRDKMMMGLIPAPEPKFKLSNFMKVLGDQAVADPSKVELRVLQQMQQRVLNHEMRNQAAKLTPQEKREKKLRKLQEDVSRGVSVAVFRVSDFASLKLRYKVDVNAQQLFLSGIVLLCAEAGTAGTGGRNLVVAEGGPRGIRKFVRLMTERIKWASDEGGVEEEEEGSDDDDEEEEGEEGEPSASSASGAGGGGGGSAGAGGGAVCNRCDLLWQGLLPKRGFTGFRFQEAASAAAAKKLLRLRGCAHYWDMVEGADNMLASSAALALF